MAGGLIQREHVSMDMEDHWAKMLKDWGAGVCQPRTARLSMTLVEWLEKAAWIEENCPDGVLIAVR